MPKVVSRQRRSTLWSTVSNAELKSNSTSKVTLWLSILIRMSLYTLRRAVSVLWPARYADWSAGYRSDWTNWSCVWLYTALSVSLEINCRLLTSLRFEREAFWPDFWAVDQLGRLSTPLESDRESWSSWLYVWLMAHPSNSLKEKWVVDLVYIFPWLKPGRVDRLHSLTSPWKHSVVWDSCWI